MKTSTLAVALLAMAMAMAWNVSAHEGHDDVKSDGTGKGPEKRILPQKKALPDLPGKDGSLATVRYVLGQESLPHEHPGAVYALRARR
jgi:hypothetical protein